MNNNNRLKQILRSIAFVSLTGGMLLLIQGLVFKLLFKAQIISEIVFFLHATAQFHAAPQSCVNPTWCSELFIQIIYIPSAIIICFASLALSVVWYYIALKLEPDFSPRDNMISARLIWGTFLLLPLLCILGVVGYYTSYMNLPQALPFLYSFLIFDVAWIYWQATAISTPLILCPVIPWSYKIRDFLRRKN